MYVLYVCHSYHRWALTNSYSLHRIGGPERLLPEAIKVIREKLAVVITQPSCGVTGEMSTRRYFHGRCVIGL